MRAAEQRAEVAPPPLDGRLLVQDLAVDIAPGGEICLGAVAAGVEGDVRAPHLPGSAVGAAVGDAGEDDDGRGRGPPPPAAADRYHDRGAVAGVDSGDPAVTPGQGRDAERVDRAHRVHGREAIEFDLLAGRRGGQRVSDTDRAVGGVDEVGSLRIGHRGAAQAQPGGGAGDPAGGRRVSGLQELAQHRPVQLAQRPGPAPPGPPARPGPACGARLLDLMWRVESSRLRSSVSDLVGRLPPHRLPARLPAGAHPAPGVHGCRAPGAAARERGAPAPAQPGLLPAGRPVVARGAVAAGCPPPVG